MRTTVASADIGLIWRSFFSSPSAFSRASLGELGLLDLLLDLGEVVAAFLAVAELLLDRLHLLVQVVLALRLLHLTLDAAPDLPLDLQHGDLALHQREDALQPLGDRGDLEDLLLLGDLDGEMRGDGVGELGIVLDLARGAEHLGRDLLVELHVALELRDDRAGERLDLVLGADGLLDALDLGLEIVLVARCSGVMAARRVPSTSTFTVPSGSFKSCSTEASVPMV